MLLDYVLKYYQSNYIFLLSTKMTRREDIMVMKQGKERVSVKEHCWLAEFTEQNMAVSAAEHSSCYYSTNL